MRSMQPVFIGIAVGLLSSVVVLAAAELLGVTQEAFGSLVIVCAAAGSLTGSILHARAEDRAKAESRARRA